MSDNKINEQLSALMDGVLEREATRFALRAAAASPESRDWWARQHLASDLLRKRQVLPAGRTLAERVATALADEPQQARRPGGAPWLRMVAGGAIAASVAVFALMIAQPGIQAPAPAAPAALVEAPVSPVNPQAERRMIAQRGPALAASQPASAVVRPQVLGPLPTTAALRVQVDPHWTMVHAPIVVPAPVPAEPTVREPAHSD